MPKALAAILRTLGWMVRFISRQERGFSLVELMVVVAIIGILAAIAVPNFQKFTAKSKQTEAKVALLGIYAAEKAFQAEWTIYQGGFGSIGYNPVGVYRYSHGFGGNVALPANYPTGAGTTPTDISTGVAAVCGTVAAPVSGCSLVTGPVAPGAVTGTITAAPAATFLAQARGDIDGDATIDVWTMNQNKQLLQATDDVNN